MGVDTAKLKERFDRKSGRADRLELHDGDNSIRLLPPSLQYMTDTVDYIAFEYLIHYQLGVEGDKKAEICPKSFEKKNRCPICEAVAKLYRLNTPEDKALGGQIRAKKRYLFNTINLDDKEKGIQIMEVGVKIYEAIVQFTVHPKWGDLLDLDAGRDITITKTNRKESQSGYEEYSVAPDPTITSTREYLPEKFKESIAALQKAIPPAKTYEELKVILEGGDSAVDLGAVKAATTPVASEGDDTSSESSTPPASAAKTAAKTVVEAKPQNKVVSTTPVAGGPKKSPLKMVEKDGQQVPYCFGDLYAPRRAECIPCEFKVECRAKFLEM